MLVSVSFLSFFLFCLEFCVLLVCCFVFNFFYECIICWGRAVFRRSFLELMFVFGKRNGVAVLLLRFLFVFFKWLYHLLKTRCISSKVFGINVRFRETKCCRRFVASVFVCFFNECIVCWGRAVFCRRFLELVFVFGKRIVVAVVLFYLLRLFVFEEKMLLEEVGLRLSERFVII